MIQTLEETLHRFKYHPITVEQKDRIDVLRQSTQALAAVIFRSCPDGREKAGALEELRSAMSRAILSIAEEPKPPGVLVMGEPVFVPGGRDLQAQAGNFGMVDRHAGPEVAGRLRPV